MSMTCTVALLPGDSSLEQVLCVSTLDKDLIREIVDQNLRSVD